MKMKKHIGKIIMTLILTLVIIIQMSIIPTNAEPTTKTMTVTIGEGKVDQSDLSKTITIPNLKEIVNITSNTGSVTYSIEGEKLIINAIGGKPSRSVYNEKKYSKVVTDSRTYSSPSFPEDIAYNSGGFLGTLSKNGNYYSSEGSWIEVDSSKNNHGKGLPEGCLYFDWLDSNGDYGIGANAPFENRLSSSGSGKYYPEYTGYIHHYLCVQDKEYKNKNNQNPYKYTFYTSYDSQLDGISARSGNYSAIQRAVENLSMDGSVKYFDYNGFNFRVEYIRMSSGRINNGWLGKLYYRLQAKYTQNYSGTVYKAGYDNYYKYKIEIEYIDNSDPEIEVSFNENEYFGKEKPISISGIVKDQDIGDILSIKYTISGVPTHNNRILLTDIKADRTNQSFSQNIEIDDSLPEGDYTIKIWAEDDKGGKSDEVSGTIKIDKTPPTMKIIIGK
ncbi:hypothetical protein ACR77J_13865 [Tissierella praeacuta]|uniref:hypothetical protein n=1 Tax=Tissierella praeacuta TaxID=43131 RepID=UPI003DA1D7BD